MVWPLFLADLFNMPTKKSFIPILLVLALGAYLGSNFSRLLIEGKSADVLVTSLKAYGTPGVLYIDSTIENRGVSDKYPDLRLVWVGSKKRPEVYVSSSEYPHDLQFRQPTQIKFKIERPSDAKQFRLIPVYPPGA